jgi:nucleoside-diphosphate-sugar epimerase
LVSKTFKLKEPVTTAYSIGVLSKSFSLNIDKATQLLKYKPTQTVDEAINEFVTLYKKNEILIK